MNTNTDMDTPDARPNGGVHLGHDGPPPDADDPTGGGYYCGARRQPGQIDEERPWKWCRKRAGQGTPHVGIGRCSNHGGSTQSGIKAARLKGISTLGAVVATFARIMADEDAPQHARIRAAENLADRFGLPRKAEVSVDDVREVLYERLMEVQASEDASN